MDTELFLTKQEREQLALYREIISEAQAVLPVAERVAKRAAGAPLVDAVNLKRISLLTGRNYTSVYRTYTALVATLTQMTGGDSAIQAMFAFDSGQVRMALIEQNIVFNTLRAMLTDQYARFADFAAATNFSKTTVSRHIKPLAGLANFMGVRLRLETLQVSGPEANIRLFFTARFWLATDGAAWPFVTIDRKEATVLLNHGLASFDFAFSNPVVKELGLYALAVVKNRLHQGFVLNTPGGAMVSFPVPNLFADKSSPFQKFGIHLTREQQFAESHFLFDLDYQLPLYQTADDPRLEQVVLRFKRYQNGLYRLVTGTIDQLPSEWVPAIIPLKSKMVLANMLAIASSTILYGFDIAGLTHLSGVPTKTQDDPQANEVRQVLENSLRATIALNDLTDFTPAVPTLVNSLSALFGHLVHVLTPPQKVKVALMITPTLADYLDLSLFLTQQAFVEVVGERYEDADLIISSTGLPVPSHVRPETQIFQWQADASSDLFGALYAVLHALHRRSPALVLV
ncbi:helix-turn-helix domain-containing protein [Lacticaseibacillus yichunensis]|uniref:Helix-turn-helix domain-containing protein n=1 Tax=Lacticaseibacillus yichunensis TaxID=2486015 RepID=A0ABW4CSU4_9LACO|nr:helix-turn-helix domain-containing protein [Lacticaseibacillus yichunensis]